jgi:hypothetical protein
MTKRLRAAQNNGDIEWLEEVKSTLTDSAISSVANATGGYTQRDGKTSPVPSEASSHTLRAESLSIPSLYLPALATGDAAHRLKDGPKA